MQAGYCTSERNTFKGKKNQKPSHQLTANSMDLLVNNWMCTVCAIWTVPAKVKVVFYIFKSIADTDLRIRACLD